MIDGLIGGVATGTAAGEDAITSGKPAEIKIRAKTNSRSTGGIKARNRGTVVAHDEA